MKPMICSFMMMLVFSLAASPFNSVLKADNYAQNEAVHPDGKMVFSKENPALPKQEPTKNSRIKVPAIMYEEISAPKMYYSGSLPYQLKKSNYTAISADNKNKGPKTIVVMDDVLHLISLFK